MPGNRGPSDSATRQLYGSPPSPDLGSKERFSHGPIRPRAPEHIRKGCCPCQSAESARNNKGIRRRLSGYRPQSASYARSCSTTRLFCGLQMLRHRGSGGVALKIPFHKEFRPLLCGAEFLQCLSAHPLLPQKTALPTKPDRAVDRGGAQQICAVGGHYTFSVGKALDPFGFAAPSFGGFAKI